MSNTKFVLFCSVSVLFLLHSCKPKPLDNLKEVAKQVEEHKVKRVSRETLATEMARVSGNVLDSLKFPLPERGASVNTGCNFSGSSAFQNFKRKYHGNIRLVEQAGEKQNLEALMETERKYMNELTAEAGKFPLVFQTQADSLLYISKVSTGQTSCRSQNPDTDVWVVTMSKTKMIEALTLKVKPKPKKGPNW